ncbi:MAG: hypothetical protein ACYTX0_42745 [Nostoc sp.]
MEKKRGRDRSPANTSDRVDHRPHQIKRVKVVPQQRYNKSRQKFP